MDHQRILSRVQKMLNLANCEGATEGERDNAMRMAHATLAKYNLDLADLDEVSELSSKAMNSAEPRMENIATFYGRPWARNVCISVANLFFCSYIYVSHKKATQVHHYFIGRKSNAVTAALISEFVVKSIMKEGNKQKRDMLMGNPWLREFCWGAAHRVQKRADSIRQDAEKPQGDVPGTALVVVYDNEQAANRQFLAVQYPKLKSGRGGKGISHGDAYGQGKAYGSKVSLNTQIGR